LFTIESIAVSDDTGSATELFRVSFLWGGERPADVAGDVFQRGVHHVGEVEQAGGDQLDE
jgi:hypothetical protein